MFSLNVMVTLLFPIGVWWLHEQRTCSVTSPALFYLSCCIIMTGYFLITAPILLYVFCCLPCAALGIPPPSRMAPHPQQQANNGASDDEIKQLPEASFVEWTSVNQEEDANSTLQPTSDTAGVDYCKEQVDRSDVVSLYSIRGYLVFDDFEGPLCTNVLSEMIIPMHDLSREGKAIPVSNKNNVCTICLGEFENEDKVRVAPCHHFYHSPCIEEWLRVNKVCPLCMRDITRTEEPQEDASLAV
jgi:hypothetical protein